MVTKADLSKNSISRWAENKLIYGYQFGTQNGKPTSKKDA